LELAAPPPSSPLSLHDALPISAVVRRINNALMRADQIERSEGDLKVDDWLAPIVADAEAGFGGTANVYELMRGMINAGAAGVHLDRKSTRLNSSHVSISYAVFC